MNKIIVTLFMCLFSTITFSQSSPIYSDAKYCGFVPRDIDGTIKRSMTEFKHFQILHPCPSTGLLSGACPGWAIDHVIPLACGGCDSVTNMQWLPDVTKSCSDSRCKDRFERKIQYIDLTMPGLNPASCSPKLLLPDWFQPASSVVVTP